MKYIIRTRRFDLNLGCSYFFHPLSLILFLFCSCIFALSLDWATVFAKIFSSFVEIIPHLVDKLPFDIYLLIAVHFCFPNLDKKFFVLISASIFLILFLFSSKSHCSFKIVLIKKECTIFWLLSFTCIFHLSSFIFLVVPSFDLYLLDYLGQSLHILRVRISAILFHS